MNKAKIQVLIRLIENMPEGLTFDMNCSGFSDRVCIGGLAGWLLSAEWHYTEFNADDALAKFAEIPYPDAQKIVWPDRHFPGTGYNQTAAQAVELLRYYMNTGEINWCRAMAIGAKS